MANLRRWMPPAHGIIVRRLVPSLFQQYRPIASLCRESSLQRSTDGVQRSRLVKLDRLNEQIDNRRCDWAIHILRGLRRAGRIGNAPSRRRLRRPAESYREAKICRCQFIKMSVELLLDLVRRLVWILVHACLVDIAAVHANIAVYDLDHARSPIFTLGGAGKPNVKVAITAA